MAKVESEPRGRFVTWWMWAVLGAPFPAMGVLTGWLVGLSNSPVVASLLPLIFGLFGAMGYGLLEKRMFEQRLRERLSGLDQAMRGPVETALALRARPLAMPVLWSVGVVLFCAVCAGGVHLGLNARLPKYEPMSQWVDVQKLKPGEGALLYSLRWKLQSAGVNRTEAAEFFEQVIKPVLALPDELIRFARLQDITNALNPAYVGRPVASLQDPQDPEIPMRRGSG